MANDAEAIDLMKRIAELEATVERMRGVCDEALTWYRGGSQEECDRLDLKLYETVSRYDRSAPPAVPVTRADFVAYAKSLPPLPTMVMATQGGGVKRFAGIELDEDDIEALLDIQALLVAAEQVKPSAGTPHAARRTRCRSVIERLLAVLERAQEGGEA